MDYSRVSYFAHQAFNSQSQPKKDFVVVFIPQDYQPETGVENTHEYIELVDASSFSSSDENSRDSSPSYIYYNNAENNV